MNFCYCEAAPGGAKIFAQQILSNGIRRIAQRALIAPLLISIGVVSACSMPTGPKPTGDETRQSPEAIEGDDRLNATLWQQTAAEYRVVTRIVYTMAKLQLERALADPAWTAERSQSEGLKNLPPAVIMDIDETVLDNSAFQGRLIKDHLSYSDRLWRIWGVKQQATEIPGAVDYISFAQARGVAVFFVTNRDQSDEPAVRKLLTAMGVNLGGNTDTILSRGERPDWGSDKASRRRFIAQSHRVLLIVGDDLGDFISEYRGTPEDRLKETFKHSEWGTKWIMIPNPIYGSWERSLYGFKALSNEEIMKRKLEYLKWVN